MAQSVGKTAYHIAQGRVDFPYAIDANSAVASHPGEWSFAPWPQEEAAKQRAAFGYEDPPPPSKDEMKQLSADAKEREAAARRLQAYEEQQARLKADEDQAARDRALLASPPPQPDPNVRRPVSESRRAAAVAETQTRRAEADRAAAEKRAVLGPAAPAEAPAATPRAPAKT